MDKNQDNEGGDLMTGEDLLKKLFPNPKSRLTERWLRSLRAADKIPYYKLGNRVFYKYNEVKQTIDNQFHIKAKNN